MRSGKRLVYGFLFSGYDCVCYFFGFLRVVVVFKSYCEVRLYRYSFVIIFDICF